MKKSAWIALPTLCGGLLLGLLLAAGAAEAQTAGTNTVERNGYYFNSTTGAKTDADGNQHVVDQARDRDNWIVYSNAINDTISNGALVGTAWAAAAAAYSFCAESTIVIPCAQYRRFALFMQSKPPGADTTTAVVRYAVQVRAHTSSVADSTNTFFWSGWNAGTVNMADSVGVGTSGQAGNGALPLSGEKIIDFDPRRGYGGFTFAQQFGWPNGLMLDLVDVKGQPFWAPYISIRVRMIGGGAAAAKPRIIVHLAMGS